MKNRIKANKKGFTLIELLAVIVVLAIIMILAVPNIIDSMNKAKKKSFQMYAEKMLNSALTEYESRKMLSEAISPHRMDGDGQYCYTLEDLGITSPGSYKGFVRVNHATTATNGKSDTTYQVYLTDEAYLYNGTMSDQVQNNIDSILNINCDKSKENACLNLNEAVTLMNSCISATNPPA